MESLRAFITIGSGLWLLISTSSTLQAQSRHVAELLPPTTSVYVESVGSEQWLSLPLTQSLLATDVFAELWRSPDIMKLRGGITLAELALSEKITHLLARATKGGLVIAGDASTGGVAMISDCQENEICQSIFKRLIQLAQNDPQNRLNSGSYKQVDYRGLPAYEVNGAIVVALDHWLVVGNKAEYLRKIADTFLDSPERSLGRSNPFARERLSSGGELNDSQLAASPSETTSDNHPRSMAWLWINVEQLRSAGAAKDLFKGPRDNFVAQLLVGGLQATARNASTITARLQAESGGLQLQIITPRIDVATAPEYAYFFGTGGHCAAPPPISIDKRIATLSVYRDMRALWRSAGELFDQRTNDQMAQADTTLTTLFSGRDFGEDILGAIEPGWQLIVAPNDFTRVETPVPEVKLPSFALVAKLRDPALMQSQLKRIFMSLVGFLNVVGAMNQQPQLDIEVAATADTTTVSTHYVLDADRQPGRAVPVQFNFSPSLVMYHDHIVLSSTRSLAGSIAQQLQGQTATMPVSSVARGASSDLNAADCNTLLKIDGMQVAAALADNRSQLISQNVLEKGHTEEEASQEVDRLLKILRLVGSFEIRLDVDEQAVLTLNLSKAP